MLRSAPSSHLEAAVGGAVAARGLDLFPAFFGSPDCSGPSIIIHEKGVGPHNFQNPFS